MLINQAYISKSLAGLYFRKIYKLKKYTDSSKPLVMFGMYRTRDMDVYLSHKSDLVLVWQGCDARDLTDEWAELLKMRNCTHYAISHWIANRLKKHGIKYKQLPISATKPKLNVCKRGDAIYFYSSDLSPLSARYHGEYFIEQIKERTGIEVIRATLKTYSKDELYKIYEKCFINLRLTKYDGCPNTNLEIGLMGRKSIFNGHIPHSIKWKTIDDICESIMYEYEHRHEDNTHIAEDIYNYMNINKSFLEI